MRVTEKDLKSCAAIINNKFNLPTEPYYRDADGNFKTNPGVYLIDSAYGGHKLCRMSLTPDCSGQSDISRTGYTPKKKLYTWMCAFIAGIEEGSK